MEGTYRNRTAFVYTNSAGDTGTSATASLLEHVIPSAELSAVASMDRGRVRFASEARTSLVKEEYRGGYDDEGAGYRYLTIAMASRQREGGRHRALLGAGADEPAVAARAKRQA